MYGVMGDIIIPTDRAVGKKSRQDNSYMLVPLGEGTARKLIKALSTFGQINSVLTSTVQKEKVVN